MRAPTPSAVYSIYTSPNHAPIPNHLPTLIVTPHGNPSQILYSFIHASYNRECFLLTPCVTFLSLAHRRR